MDSSKKSRFIAVATVTLMILSLVWVLNTKRSNNSLESGLQDEKLHSETLLSEKLLLEKDLQKFKDQMLALRDSNRDLDILYKSTISELEKQQAEFDRLKKENRTLAQVKKQRADLIAMQSQLENELQTLKASQEGLDAKNKDLESTVALLQDRNRLLLDDLNRAMFSSIDQSMVQTVKGKKEKLTVRAARTKKLIANFEVPAEYNNLSFRVVDLNGNLVSSNETIRATALPSVSNYVASSDTMAETKKLQNVEMVFTPKQKLKTGVYMVEISNENLYVASLRVKLK